MTESIYVYERSLLQSREVFDLELHDIIECMLMLLLGSRGVFPLKRGESRTSLRD